MRRNREAELLKKTFKDRMTVRRKRLKRDPDTHLSREEEEIIFENTPCGFSQSNNSTPERNDFHSEKQFDAVIFSPPGIYLKENDVITVTTEAGQVFTGTSGKTFAYISHGETPFTIEGKT